MADRYGGQLGHGAVRQMNDFMIARGMTAKKLDSSQFLEGSFLEALK